jgi:hypothetical protein
VTSNADITRRFRIVGQDEGAVEAHDQRSSVTLRSLQLMSVADLRRSYERAESPTDIVGLDGLTRGTLLTLVGPLSQGTARVLTNRVARWARFPWIGKSFQSWAEDRGSGINRLRLLGERLWLHFETRVDRSQLDGRPCIVLDYDHAENPWPVRLVRDELREVAPGLWLGPATVRGHVALFFALESP